MMMFYKRSYCFSSTIADLNPHLDNDVSKTEQQEYNKDMTQNGNFEKGIMDNEEKYETTSNVVAQHINTGEVITDAIMEENETKHLILSDTTSVSAQVS